MATTLRYVGDFLELGYDHHPGAPSLAACRGKRGPEHKQEVVGYLRGGHVYIYSPGIDEDVFDPSKMSDTPSILTDGVFAWPMTLAYYVDRYDVVLPAEFEEHMRNTGWQVAATIDKRALVLPKFPG